MRAANRDPNGQKYWFEYTPTQDADLAISQANYLLEVFDKEGKPVRAKVGWNSETRNTEGDAITIEEKEVGYTLKFTYLDFLSLFEKAPAMTFVSHAWYQPQKIADLPAFVTPLVSGRNKCVLPKLYQKYISDQLASGDLLDVYLQNGNDNSNGEFKLGSVILVD